MRDLLLNAIDVCVTHRTLYHARRDGNSEAIAAATASVAKLYDGADFIALSRYREWAERNLIDTTSHGRYETEAERDEEVSIATAIRDQVKAVQDKIVHAVIGGDLKNQRPVRLQHWLD